MFGFLSDDLSPWGMFLHADIVVKIVIVGLVFASIVTWTIWLVKTLELALAKLRLRRAYRVLRDSRSLTSAAGALGTHDSVARALVREAGGEWRRSVEALEDSGGLKERIALHLERVEALSGRHMMVGTGVLATIGSTAPFVGLFGTVWGIMNSFIGIAKMHTTNLAVVAPGIAEALLATACGLVAAIPAVVIYNHFVRQIAGYKALVANAASTVMALVSRDLSHGDHAIADAQEPPDGKTPLQMVAE
jgi:biopolymer transport protein ExbB